MNSFILTFLLLLSPMQTALSAGGRTGAVASGSAAAHTFVGFFQQNQGNNPTNTFSYTCTAGDFLYVQADTKTQSAATNAITISGNTYVPVFTNVVTSAGFSDITASAGYVTSCSGGAVTFTNTPSAGSFGNLLVVEYTKGTLSGVLDQAGTPCVGASGGQWPACSATASAAGELVIMGMAVWNSVTSWNPATGWNLRFVAGTGSPNSDAVYDVLSSTSGTNTIPSTYNALDNSTIVFPMTIK